MSNLYKCNEDGVTEWCIAESKKQAYDFMVEFWGASTMQEYLGEYLEDNKEGSLEEFIENFFTEEELEKDFTIRGEKGEDLTLKVREWIEAAKTVPSYLCCGDY